MSQRKTVPVSATNRSIHYSKLYSAGYISPDPTVDAILLRCSCLERNSDELRHPGKQTDKEQMRTDINMHYRPIAAASCYVIRTADAKIRKQTKS